MPVSSMDLRPLADVSGGERAQARSVRRFRILLPVVCLAFALLPAHGAQAAPARVGAAAMSPNVEWLGTLTPNAGAEGIRLVGDYLYVTADGGGLAIYDVGDPAAPVRTGSLFLPHIFENEDIDTNGSILLFSQGSLDTLAKQAVRARAGIDPGASLLHVVDVSDKRAPRILSSVVGGGDHTMSCLLDCTWAYGASGYILDLRNPTAPRVSDRSWLTSAGLDGAFAPAHDLVEVERGLLLSASIPMLLLDARHDPERPRVLAMSEGSTMSFHNVSWPDRGRSDVILSANEAMVSPRCEVRDGLAGSPLADSQTVGDSAIQSWDARAWERTGRFKPLAQYRVDQGAWTDGDPAVMQSPLGGCAQHYFDPHPAFRDGGWVAAASYGHGVKFLRVDDDGAFAETGWFLPAGASTLAALWASDDIVYVVDFQRGVDILRVLDAPTDGAGRGGPRRWEGAEPPPASAVAAAQQRTLPSGALLCLVRL
jgi:hypothetical protein